jgi:hypothetical protein
VRRQCPALKEYCITHVDVTVKPSGKVGLAEETEGTLVVRDGFELGLVERERVAVLLPALELGNVAVSGSGKEVLGTSSEH